MKSKFVLMCLDDNNFLTPVGVAPGVFCDFLDHLETEHPDYGFFDFPNDFCSAYFYFCDSRLVAFCFLDSDTYISQIKTDIALNYPDNY